MEHWLHELEYKLVMLFTRRGRGSVGSVCFHERERRSMLPFPLLGEYALRWGFGRFLKKKSCFHQMLCIMSLGQCSKRDVKNVYSGVLSATRISMCVRYNLPF